MRQVAQRVREERLAAGLTQEEAAHRARVDYRYWQSVESGSINLEIDTLVRIARALGGTFWTLLTPPEGRAPRRRPGRPRNPTPVVLNPGPKRPRGRPRKVT